MTSFDIHALITLPGRALMQFFVAIMEWGVAQGLPVELAALTAMLIVNGSFLLLLYALEFKATIDRRRKQGGAQ